MRICVTGNKGFVGGALQRAIEAKGWICLGIEQWIFERGKWHEMLTQYVEKLNPDAIFHVGAIADTRCTDVPMIMTRNVLSTMLLSDWCQANNKPFIFSSSASVTGSSGLPETLYAASKYIGETYAIGRRQVALRYFNVYGENEYHKGKMASVACQAYMKCKWGEPFRLFPTGPRRDFVYIQDVVDANLHALENYEGIRGKYYDVGSGQDRSFEEVMDILGLRYEYAEADSIPENYQQFTKANPELFMPGWTPKYTIEEGLPRYLAHMRISTVDPSLS
jgi:ADP-L-glycero-D-manno-heptose 6-epimerase